MVRSLSIASGCAGLLVVLLCAASAPAEWRLEEKSDRVIVELDGQPFTEYLFKSGTKPILWPLIGPTGKAITRAYPLADAEGEQRDHVHQRSCWFTHGKVNDVDFWSEQPGHGSIEQRELREVHGGREGTIVTRNDWLGPDGRRQCSDERKITFRAGDAQQRIFDFSIRLLASDGPVVFGDTKEGSFGTRVATSISVEGKQGGRIVNSDGAEQEAAWGRRAAWVDYHGPAGGETVGMAILNHPDSFRYPTYWHVRPYGLFAANPFGVHDFTGEGDGSYTLPAGENLTLHYRVILHRGDATSARIAASFEAYAKEKP